MRAVLQVRRDPEEIFGVDAPHTPEEVHDRKKPSNYTCIPNLDLTAEELRDALVKGKIDGISAFAPMEIRYRLNLDETGCPEPLAEKVKLAPRSRKKRLDGKAVSITRLSEDKKGSGVSEFIESGALPKDIDDPTVEDMLYRSDIMKEFVVRIERKSDPEAMFLGNTLNCMPLADGRDTLHVFNPNTAHLVIRMVMADGEERTIAQSMLTKDVDIKTLVPDVLHKLRNGKKTLEAVLPPDILVSAPSYVACDCVKVAPNYSGNSYQKIIETLYRDFFHEYLDLISKQDSFNTEKVLIGIANSGAFTHLPREQNTFIPQAPVSQSNKLGREVLVLDISQVMQQGDIAEKSVRKLLVQKREKGKLPNVSGIGLLTFEDTLKVSMLEDKAYADNRSLVQYLHNMENALIAKDINNSAKIRPNMSIKYEDENGKMRGYLLAWEGKLSDENIEDEADEWLDEPCIYISDLATDREHRLAGGRLMQGFIDLYKRNYLEKENLISLYLHARERTSYRIFQRQLERQGKSIGIRFEAVEFPEYESGNDTMHPIILRPVRPCPQLRPRPGGIVGYRR